MQPSTPHRAVSLATSAPPADDRIQRRAVAVGLTFGGGADMHEAGDPLVGGAAQCFGDVGVVGVPFGQPAGAKAECIGGQAHVEAGGTAREHLFPFRRARRFDNPADHGDDSWRMGKAAALGIKPDG
jgi:hypothetical protein